MSRMSDHAIELQNVEDPKTLGGRIENARGHKLMTQSDLAVAIGKTRGSITQYERDAISPPLSVISQLAAALDVTPEYLAFGIDIFDAESGLSRLARVPTGEIEPDSQSFSCTSEAAIPLSILHDFVGQSGSAKLIRLDVDAPHFGLARSDFILVNSDAKLSSDGNLYAVPTSGGLAVMKSLVRISGHTEGLVLQDGNGSSHHLGVAPEVFGRVTGALTHL